MVRWLVVVALLGSTAVQAQTLWLTAQGVLRPVSGVATDAMLLEVLGRGPDGQLSEYVSLDLLPGALPTAMAGQTAALAAPMLNRYTRANAQVSYDLSAPDLRSVPVPGASLYDGNALHVSLQGDGGLTGAVQSAQTRVAVRDRGSLRYLLANGAGAGYPPDTLPMGESLVFQDPAPASFHVDLRDLMASASCCSTLHLSAPGPLPVLLQSPLTYRPVYAGFELFGSRSSSDPMDASLLAASNLARYDSGALSLVFGGHYSLQVNAADYANSSEHQAAQAWIDANIGVVNVEIPVYFDITAMQAVPVPEPANAGLLLTGLLALAAWRRRAAGGR